MILTLFGEQYSFFVVGRPGDRIPDTLADVINDSLLCPQPNNDALLTKNLRCLISSSSLIHSQTSITFEITYPAHAQLKSIVKRTKKE
jgi:hypothetical protein